eukprot:5269477-Alexandrium_andersonii.AAC.1
MASAGGLQWCVTHAGCAQRRRLAFGHPGPVSKTRADQTLKTAVGRARKSARAYGCYEERERERERES